MSDVIVSTNDPITTVTTTDNLVEIAITNNPVEVSASTAGVQGASYEKGDPIYEYVRNSTGATLLKGQIVYLSGATGNHVNVSLAQASGDNTSARTIGWVSENILNNAEGYVMMFGYLKGIDTSAANAVGDILYLSPTVAGAWTSTKPQAPDHLVYVGVCVRKNPSNGVVSVHIQNGYELGELHDVQIVSPVNNQVLTYDSATDLWKNATNPTDGVTSITATAPLTGGTITSTGSIGLDQTALSITQSQVSNLVSDLAGKANLAGGNALTGAQTITSTAIGQVPLTLVGASGQTANLLSTAGGARIPAAGNYFIAPGLTSTFVADFNAGNATTTPVTIAGVSGQTANLLRLAVAGSDVAVFTPTGTFRTAGLITAGDVANVLGQLSVYTTAASRIGAVIRGAGSQTADALQIQNSGGLVQTYFDAFGNGHIAQAPSGSSFGLYVGTNANPAVGGIMVRGAASQTGDLQQWQNSAGSIIAKVDSVGDITARVQRSTFAARFTTTDPSIAIQVNTAAASQTGDYIQFQNSGGTVVSRIQSDGSLTAASLVVTGGGTYTTGSIYSDSNWGMLFRANRLNPVNAQYRWANSADGELMRLDNSGRLIVSTAFSGATQGTAQIEARTVNATTIGMILRGAASQTANLQEWQNSAGTVLGRVASDGSIFTSSFTTNNGRALIGENTSGGTLRMERATGAQTNPGANLARLYFRDGTNAGTLKLVVRAGAAGAETTILDNIPQ